MKRETKIVAAAFVAFYLVGTVTTAIGILPVWAFVVFLVAATLVFSFQVLRFEKEHQQDDDTDDAGS